MKWPTAAHEKLQGDTLGDNGAGQISNWRGDKISRDSNKSDVKLKSATDVGRGPTETGKKCPEWNLICTAQVLTLQTSVVSGESVSSVQWESSPSTKAVRFGVPSIAKGRLQKRTSKRSERDSKSNYVASYVSKALSLVVPQITRQAPPIVSPKSLCYHSRMHWMHVSCWFRNPVQQGDTEMLFDCHGLRKL